MSHLRNQPEDENLKQASECAASGLRLWRQYMISQEMDDLESAIVKQQLAVQLAPEGYLGLLTWLNNLGAMFHARFERFGELDVLESAISMQQRVVELMPDDHPNMAKALNNLGSHLQSRFDRLGEFDDLENAISMQRRALELTPDDHSDRYIWLISLGNCLRNRFERLEELNDLESAISMQRRALELIPDDHSILSHGLNELGASLQSRFKRLGELDDLENAISMQRRAVELMSESHSDMPGRLNYLGGSFQSRFERLGELHDLENAISMQRRAVELTPNEHPDMPIRLGLLGTALWRRFERFGEPNDLESAISAEQQAVELTPQGHPDMPGRLNYLRASLQSRFERFGELADLESVISIQRRAVNLTPEDHCDLPRWLSSLGDSLQSRFKRLGEFDDLENAISIQRRAVELTPEGHPDLPGRLNNLGFFLQSRFERLEQLDNLENESAISAQHRILELTPEGRPDIPGQFTNLEASFRGHFERSGELDDLESAISMQRRAVELTPDGHPDMPGRLNNLGGYLASCFEYHGNLDDLESAILTQRRVVDITPEGHPDMPTFLHNLSSCLQSRFKHVGELDDLESAILMQRSAVELTPEDHHILATQHFHLGSALREYFRRAKTQQNFDAVVNSLVTASLQSMCLPYVRIHSARAWATLETEHPEFGSSAARMRAHSSIVNILPELVWLGHNIAWRYQQSSEVAKLVNDAVSAAIDLGNLSQAVEWLEAGRGLIWSQVLSLRAPVDDLAQHHPNLANDLRILSKQLQHAHLLNLPKATRLDPLSDEDVNQHRKLVINYERCLKEIRACPGFEYFLRPQKLTNLASLVEHIDGPVVFINVSSSRCDALVVSSEGTVELIPLPELNQSRSDKMRALCAKYLRANRVRNRGTVPLGAVEADGFLRLLDKLWLWIVRPVLEALGFINDRCEQLHHITWCPTGSLTQLPLHAAGLYRESGSSGPHVYDFVVSSYTPSLAALVRARNGVASQTSSPSVLVVTQPATPELSPLPGTTQEGARLYEILSESHIESVAFSGAQATVASIESVIGQFPWVHFACHGVQDVEDPTQSAFALHDGRLTLSTLMKMATEGAELAFLSACQTATGDEKVPEESAHLAAGMLAVGFKGVVGTMWSIGDADAPVVVETYYKKLLELRRTGAVAEGSTGAAYALHEAVKCLRERVGERSFMRWVPFVHYGV